MPIEFNIKEAEEARIWRAAVVLNRFNRSQLRRQTHRAHRSIGEFVSKWHNEGRIIRDVVRANPGKEHYYLISKDFADKIEKIELRNRSKISNMWTCVRMLPSYSAKDISMHGTTPKVVVTEHDAEALLHLLFEARYLREVTGFGLKTEKPIYRLARKVGPKPVQFVTVPAVYDPNTDKHTYIEGPTL